ncbi:MAG: hypothetical protein IVW54_18045 [Candidatus Binataceae bacterium]|jgi:parvulin-like peptidyl-prolyl isomerase|nr:hypothetical protein [Candidatus Binataceae bacterium]
MKTIAIGTIVLGALISATAPAFAGPVGVGRTATAERQVTLSQLEARREQVGQQMPEPPKGAALGRWMSKRIQLDDLINRLKNGQQVAPEEIDRALR